MSWQMWFFLIFGPLALIVATITGVLAITSDRRSTKDGAGGVALVASGVVLLSVMVLALGCFTTVGVRQIGIETNFGRPNGITLENGLHLKKPWVNVTEMDGAIQIDKYDQDGTRIKIRLGNNSTAGADTSIRWQIKSHAADSLFVQYKSFDNVRVNLIERNLQVALNEVFQSFDPLAKKWENGVPLQTFANEAADKLRGIVGEQVEILDISVARLDYDTETESKINQLNAERASTAVALQAGATADAQRIANEKLAGSVSNDPNVIVSNCVNKALDRGLSPFGCWPGASASPIIPVPGK